MGQGQGSITLLAFEEDSEGSTIQKTALGIDPYDGELRPIQLNQAVSSIEPDQPHEDPYATGRRLAWSMV